MKHLILSLFVLHMIILTYLNSTYVGGLPLRSYLILLCAGLVFLEGSAYFSDLKLLNRVYAILGIAGIVISIYNSVPVSDIVQSSSRMLQSWLLIISGYYLMVQFGYRALVYSVLLVAIPSAIVGVLQYMGVDVAWQLREVLGSFQNTESSAHISETFIDARLRPPGLTSFAITQVYLLFTAIAMALLVYNHHTKEKKSVTIILLLIFILFVGVVASETRSAIGAVTVLVFVTLLKSRPVVTLFLSLVIGGSIITIQAYKASQQTEESRVVGLEDQSAKGRATLYKYGLELALKKPFGYGYGFDSVKLAGSYFINGQNWFTYGPKEKAQFLVEIHNSILNVTHTFGLLGFFILIGYMFKLAQVNWFFLLVILTYLINSFFHNAGILSDDLYIDVFIAIILYYKYQTVKTHPPPSSVVLQT